ncbi:unnamed protein product [Callosobruchus maculatus]|nr:unnamed protein product [Callosobruchus maculatus]
MGFPSNNQYAANCFCPGNYLQAQKQYVPGGVAFSFNTGQPFFAQMQFPNSQPQFNNTFAQNPQCYPQPPQQHIMVGSLQPSPQQQLDAMQYKLMQCQKDLTERMDFQQNDNQNVQASWKFHKNVGTTSYDLLNYHTQTPGSKSTPDFSNISGIDPQPPAICHSGDVKKITLAKPIEKPKGHVSDILDEEKKTVSFNERSKEKCTCDEEEDEVKQMIDKSEQATLFTCCCSLESNDSATDSESEDTDEEIEKLYSIMEEELFCDHCRQLLRMMKSRLKKSKRKSKRKSKDYDSSYCSTSDQDY